MELKMSLESQSMRNLVKEVKVMEFQLRTPGAPDLSTRERRSRPEPYVAEPLGPLWSAHMQTTTS